MGEIKYLKHLYINDYAEFDSKIILFHDYLLACEISTEMTLASTGGKDTDLAKSWHKYCA